MRLTQYKDFGYYYILSKLREKVVLGENARNFFLKHSDYGDSQMCSVSVINKLLCDLIISEKPFMVGRLGGTELSALKIFDFGLSDKYEKCLEQMQTWSGFFPKTLEAGNAFKELMIDVIPEADILGVWGQPFEDYYMSRFGSEQLKSVYLPDLEPWSYPENPWSAALKNKKVLIIHPFADTLKKQYAKREKIYPGTEILPQFDLDVLKAVQTVAGEKDDRFQNWFEALDWMYDEALKRDFSIAIIGCGAYGFPLAAKLKRVGKQAVHLGGATQLFFGIKGRRWETESSYKYVQRFFNDFWVYPDYNERPKRASEVENGCYW